jgi:hypothetical protein
MPIIACICILYHLIFPTHETNYYLFSNWLGGRVRGTKAIIFHQTKRGFAGRSSPTVKKSREVGREMSLLGPNGDPPNQLHFYNQFEIKMLQSIKSLKSL